MNFNINNISLQVGEEHKYLIPKLQYVLDTYESIYHLNKPIMISYGANTNEGVHIKPGDVGNFFTLKNEIPEYSMIEWDNKMIPILFTSEKNVDWSFIQKKEKGYSVNGDILLSAFYFLSSWQEYVSTEKDDLGRFPYIHSFIRELEVVKIPIVNYYFDILSHSIEKCSSSNVSMNKQHKKGLKIGITHDIDNCQTGSFQDSYRQFLSGEWLPAIKKGFKRLYRDDIWFNFEQLINIEQKYGVLSSYYFIPENKALGGYSNADYIFQSDKIQSEVKKIQGQGHEIALHGSIGTGFNQIQLQDEIKKFSNPIFGNRFHNLMFTVKDSFPILEESNINYDCSLGFSEEIGFRNGFCFPYHPYNFEEDLPFSFYEFPFQMMDRTLIQPNYMGLSPEEAKEAICRIMDEIMKFSGYFIFIWHNNTITGFKYKKWKSVFTYAIEYGLENNAEFMPLASFYSRLTK